MLLVMMAVLFFRNRWYSHFKREPITPLIKLVYESCFYFKMSYTIRKSVKSYAQPSLLARMKLQWN